MHRPASCLAQSVLALHEYSGIVGKTKSAGFKSSTAAKTVATRIARNFILGKMFGNDASEVQCPLKMKQTKIWSERVFFSYLMNSFIVMEGYLHPIVGIP